MWLDPIPNTPQDQCLLTLCDQVSELHHAFALYRGLGLAQEYRYYHLVGIIPPDADPEAIHRLVHYLINDCPFPIRPYKLVVWRIDEPLEPETNPIVFKVYFQLSRPARWMLPPHSEFHIRTFFPLDAFEFYHSICRWNLSDPAVHVWSPGVPAEYPWTPTEVLEWMMRTDEDD